MRSSVIDGAWLRMSESGAAAFRSTLVGVLDGEFNSTFYTCAIVAAALFESIIAAGKEWPDLSQVRYVWRWRVCTSTSCFFLVWRRCAPFNSVSVCLCLCRS